MTRTVEKKISREYRRSYQYNLISAPQKNSDKRGEHMPETWQAEALDPAVLAQILEDALTALIGADAMAAAQERTKEERAKIIADLKKITE